MMIMNEVVCKSPVLKMLDICDGNLRIVMRVDTRSEGWVGDLTASRHK